MNLNEIKLIIWDLDETFWKGTLTEGTVIPQSQNMQLLQNMADAGVISSICSKNNLEAVQSELIMLGIWDLFVFPSVNWTPKGERVRQIIKSMKLREPNVLFIDDNALNREEVRFVCPDMMIADVDILPRLWTYFDAVEKKDPTRSRLQQYHLLEQKARFQAEAGSNARFLEESDIQVQIRENCAVHLDRIENLVLRANQLNFTKVRSNRQELERLLKDPSVRAGYVQVQDRFGDYGITGFFAVKDNRLLHFVFSCRTLNMGVEQYVYEYLGRPELEITGEVASDPAGPRSYWINQKNGRQSTREKEHITAGGKILIKGLCDMQQIFAFVSGGKHILTEFVYINDNGVSIESGCHTEHIVQSLSLDKAVQERLIRSLPFGDAGMFSTSVYDPDIRFVFLTLLTDPNLGLYQEVESGAVVAFGEYTNDLTDETIWQDMIGKKRFVANCNFTEENLEYIREHFVFLGRISPEKTVDNLEKMLSAMAPRAKLILLLGCETPYENNHQPAYDDRHLYHKALNEKVRDWASGRDRVILLDINDYIRGQQDFTNNINHYNKEVYYKLSKTLIEIINRDSRTKLRESTAVERVLRRMMAIVRKIPQKIYLAVKRRHTD